MKTDTIVLQNLSDTELFGKVLGENVQAGDVVCLDGDLGSGKTTLTQAIARGLYVPEKYYVTSPSFAIMQEYLGRLVLYHMDFYRLHDARDVEDLGFEECFYGSGVTVIEWSMRASELLPSERLSLTIILNSDLSRTVQLTSTLKHNLLEKVLANFPQSI